MDFEAIWHPVSGTVGIKRIVAAPAVASTATFNAISWTKAIALCRLYVSRTLGAESIELRDSMDRWSETIS